MECFLNERITCFSGEGCVWDDDQAFIRSGERHKTGGVWVVHVCVCLSLSLSSELTRGSLIRLQQSDNGRIALGTFNELLQRQSTCGAEIKKRISHQQSNMWRWCESCSYHPPKSTERQKFGVPFEFKIKSLLPYITQYRQRCGIN